MGGDLPRGTRRSLFIPVFRGQGTGNRNIYSLGTISRVRDIYSTLYCDCMRISLSTKIVDIFERYENLVLISKRYLYNIPDNSGDDSPLLRTVCSAIPESLKKKVAQKYLVLLRSKKY